MYVVMRCPRIGRLPDRTVAWVIGEHRERRRRVHHDTDDRLPVTPVVHLGDRVQAHGSPREPAAVPNTVRGQMIERRQAATYGTQGPAKCQPRRSGLPGGPPVVALALPTAHGRLWSPYDDPQPGRRTDPPTPLFIARYGSIKLQPHTLPAPRFSERARSVHERYTLVRGEIDLHLRWQQISGRASHRQKAAESTPGLARCRLPVLVAGFSLGLNGRIILSFHTAGKGGARSRSIRHRISVKRDSGALPPRQAGTRRSACGDDPGANPDQLLQRGRGRELCRLDVGDLSPDAGTLHICDTESDRARPPPSHPNRPRLGPQPPVGRLPHPLRLRRERHAQARVLVAAEPSAGRLQPAQEPLVQGLALAAVGRAPTQSRQRKRRPP
jgi:hypothetical protein